MAFPNDSNDFLGDFNNNYPFMDEDEPSSASSSSSQTAVLGDVAAAYDMISSAHTLDTSRFMDMFAAQATFDFFMPAVEKIELDLLAANFSTTKTETPASLGAEDQDRDSSAGESETNADDTDNTNNAVEPSAAKDRIALQQLDRHFPGQGISIQQARVILDGALEVNEAAFQRLCSSLTSNLAEFMTHLHLRPKLLPQINAVQVQMLWHYRCIDNNALGKIAKPILRAAGLYRGKLKRYNKIVPAFSVLMADVRRLVQNKYAKRYQRSKKASGQPSQTTSAAGKASKRVVVCK